jgi:hypothetical protein
VLLLLLLLLMPGCICIGSLGSAAGKQHYGLECGHLRAGWHALVRALPVTPPTYHAGGVVY